MHQETELIVIATECINQNSSMFKDYVFPIASAFFTSLLGGWIAFMVLNRQESFTIEKEKLNAINKWTLEINRAKADLISIKSNYHKLLSSSPIQRLGAIPSLILKSEHITENYQDLVFITPSADDLKSQHLKWAQIPRIDRMVSNYNSLLKMWYKRNELNEEFKLSLAKHYDNASTFSFSLSDATDAVGRSKLLALIDLNERCIKLTDQIIIELNDFLMNFPAVAKNKMNLKRIKHYGKLISYAPEENESLIEIMKAVPEVDFSSVTLLYNQSIEVIKKSHLTGYE